MSIKNPNEFDKRVIEVSTALAIIVDGDDARWKQYVPDVRERMISKQIDELLEAQLQLLNESRS